MLRYVIYMLYMLRCYTYALLTDQISLADRLYFLKYWASCVLHLFNVQSVTS